VPVILVGLVLWERFRDRIPRDRADTEQAGDLAAASGAPSPAAERSGS
jgi:hypothetical protein